MAKVTLPLMGVAAHGLLGKQVMYQARAGFNAVRTWRGKRDPKTEAQMARRRTFYEAKEVWPYLTDELRALFAGMVADRKLSAWHGFLHLVLEGVVGGFTIGESIVGGWDLVWVPPCPW